MIFQPLIYLNLLHLLNLQNWVCNFAIALTHLWNQQMSVRTWRSWSEVLETSRVQLHLLSWPKEKAMNEDLKNIVSKCVWTTMWATAISTKHWCKTESGIKFQKTQQYQLNFAWKKAIRVRCRLLLPSLEHTEKVGPARRRCKRLLLPFQAMKEALETPGILETPDMKLKHIIQFIWWLSKPQAWPLCWTSKRNQKKSWSLWPPKCLRKKNI